jgi:diguanylate cyclase (GGDEF)-like protein
LFAFHSDFFKFSEQHVQLIKSFASLISYIIDLEVMANMDNLTGVFNKHSFERYFDKIINNSNDLSLLFIDLDNFKAVNDLFGHKAGDELLKQLADRMKECLEEAHFLARFGGDEFVILLPSISNKETYKVAERILKEVSAPFNINGTNYFVTSSIGISHFPENGSTLDELIFAADQAMYKVKRNGKNDISFYRE